MGNPLRDRRTPREFAASGQSIDFDDKIGDFERLAGIVEADLSALDAEKVPRGWRDRTVAGHLSFGFADAQQGLPTLEGSIAATVDAVCQRCLEPMVVSLCAEMKYLLADGEYDDYEVWELEESTLRPIDIVDEALVMAIPMSVLHVYSKDCRRMTASQEPAEDKIRPFAALRAQMDEENSAG